MIILFTDPINQGFTMTYPNGITVSVRWGTMSYSDGQTNAEVAAWYNTNRNRDWIHVPEFDYQGDDVLGNMSPVEITRFMVNAMNIPDPSKCLAPDRLNF